MTFKHLYLAFCAYVPYFFFSAYIPAVIPYCISVQKYHAIILEMPSADGFLHFFNYCEF